MINHLNYIHEIKIIDNDSFNERMSQLSEIELKIEKLEYYSDKRRVNKNFVDNLTKEIQDSIQKIVMKISSINCSTIFSILFSEEEVYPFDIEIFDNYFIPLSCQSLQQNEIQKFCKNYHIENLGSPVVKPLIEYSKNKTLMEKIEGASLIFYFESMEKMVVIHGYFKKDSLNICKFSHLYKAKMNQIKDEIEYLDAPNDFKEKYIEQLSLRDFMILSSSQIAEMLKKDYMDLNDYKNKALSNLIKEFTKSNIEKQRKIISLFLISDEESQFTAHIIFDLISDQLFLSDSQQQLSDAIYQSLHWKLQKLFKLSNTNYENSKKKIQNLTVNDVPYESRILSLKASENVKAKAMEKIKEVNGSKENSIKAQQWLDGFLRIPFGIYKKEPIIDFFKNFQNKLEQYINIFTIKLSEIDIDKLKVENQEIYHMISQVIDEYHSSILFKSENSYTLFLVYLDMIKNRVKEKLYLNEEWTDENQILQNMNQNHNFILDNLIEKNSVPSPDVLQHCIQQLNYFKKIKNDLIENHVLDEKKCHNLINRLNDLEIMLGIDVLKEEECFESHDLNDHDYNNLFIKFIIKNLYEFNNYQKEWNDFKENKKKYMEKVDKILDKCVYGQLDAKKQMKRIIGQWMNGVSKGQCFGLCGPPGVGKTTICKNGLAKCLFDENGESRPFAFLPLGGATNGSYLEGHHYTYLGSTWGKIVDILIETKCMNPIIYVDELDKISKTEQGREIASILTHITDQSQNKEFFDKYFASIPIDLSQILFIFSYNDKENIDRILRDRIQEIHIKPLTRNEKLIITKNYLCPEIYHNVGYSPEEIVLTKEALIVLIEEYTYEAGVRKLNEILYDVIREINLKKIVDNDNVYPIMIDLPYIKKFMEDKSKIHKKLIHKESRIGLVNGLYATSAGLGGLTIIQVMKTYSDKKLSIERMTGSLGDVMKDSLNLALTMCWNILPDEIKEKIHSQKENIGLHVHCPDLSTTKDGPSASLAFCLAFVSRICEIPVKNSVALTGEMDLLGNSMAIGGLESKLMGAINAGVSVALIPRENEEDLDILIRKEEEERNLLKKNSSFKNFDSCVLTDENSEIVDHNKKIYRNKLVVYIVDTIYDVLHYALEENSFEFKRMF